MKTLKKLMIGGSANTLTEKQMRALKGGVLYCHCYYETGGTMVTSCESCTFVCVTTTWSCNEYPRSA